MLDVLEAVFLSVPLKNIHQIRCKLSLDFKFYMVLLMNRVEVYELLLYINAEFFGWKHNTRVEVRIDIFICFVNIQDFTHIV